MAWASQGWWSSDSYLFTNIVFFGVIIWGMQCHDNPEPIQLAIVVNVISIILDVILLSIRYPAGTGRISDRFSAGMALVNLIVRPFTSFILYNILSERHGTNGGGGSYDNIDRPVIHSVPGGQGETYGTSQQYKPPSA